MEGYNYVNSELFLHIISRKEAINLGSEYYFTGKPCKRGHLRERRVYNTECFSCMKLSQYQYRKRNKKEIYERSIPARKKYKEDNREAILKYNREYERRCRKKNKPTIVMRDMLRRLVQQIGSPKAGSTCEVLGYSYLDFRTHIESLFLEDMSWSEGNFHIDHIYPISRYLSDGVKDPAIVNSLSNLAPLYPEDNLSKGTKTLQEWLDEKGKHSVEWERYSRLL